MALKKALNAGPRSCAVFSVANTLVLKAGKTIGANAVGCNSLLCLQPT